MTQNKMIPRPVAYAMFGLTGCLFVFFCLTGRDLAARGNILWTVGYVFRILGVSLVVGGALGALICTIFLQVMRQSGFMYVFFRRVMRWSGTRCAILRQALQCSGPVRATYGRAARQTEKESVDCAKGQFGLKSGISFGRKTGFRFGLRTGVCFGLSFGLMLLAWLPGFLAYYPGICAYDTPIQMGQVVSGSYIDHHPIAHTLLLKGAAAAGEAVFGSVNAGIAIYVLFQMTFWAVSLGAGIAFLERRGVGRGWLILLQLFCMLYPFQLYMSISVTKDMVFGSFFLLQALALCKVLETSRTRDFLYFFFSTVGMILFRNNGKYAFLVFLAFLPLIFLFGKRERRLWGRLLLWSLGAILTGQMMLSTIYRVTDAQQGDRREMLSVPIQQLARTMLYHGGVNALPGDDNTMGETDKALINDFILNEGYRKYRPEFADPVKSNTNTYVARYRSGEFITTYLRLLVQYPGDFINAVLALDAGYVYPGDKSHAGVNAQEGQAAGGGYVQTRWDEDTMNSYGVYKDSRWEWLHGIMEEWANENTYLRIPVLKYLFVPGVWIWLYLLLLGGRVLQRKFRQCIPLTLIFGYYLTLLLGPTVQLRYLYPVMMAFPFLLLAGNGSGQRQEPGVEGQWAAVREQRGRTAVERMQG